MAAPFQESLPCEVVFAFFADEDLTSVDSTADNSHYRYKCGCIAARPANDGVCLVTWCDEHTPPGDHKAGRKHLRLA